MIIIDAHLDLAWNALNWNRDLTRTVPEIRHSERNMKEERRGITTKKGIRTDKAPQPGGHYQQAVIWGDLIFVAGQGPGDPTTGQQAKGIEVQVRQTLRNIEAILHAAGSNKEHVMRGGVFLADIHDFDAMNRVYGEFFGPNPPARTTVEAGLGGILVEIDAVAVRAV